MSAAAYILFYVVHTFVADKEALEAHIGDWYRRYRRTDQVGKEAILSEVCERYVAGLRKSVRSNLENKGRSSYDHRETSGEKRIYVAALVTRRECWTLTWPGGLALSALLVAVCTFGVIEIHPFLAVTDRVPARLLVIEGWARAITMKQAAEEFRSRGYARVVLLRPVLGLDHQYEAGRFRGNRWAALLVQHGVPKKQLTTLFTNVADKDRTYHSALALKQWLADQGLSMKSMDVATQGPHARRSRLLYQKAFGDGWEIGIIALRNAEYDPVHWWRTSEGVREIMGESIAYLYARFLFHETSK